MTATFHSYFFTTYIFITYVYVLHMYDTIFTLLQHTDEQRIIPSYLLILILSFSILYYYHQITRQAFSHIK